MYTYKLSKPEMPDVEYIYIYRERERERMSFETFCPYSRPPNSHITKHKKSENLPH